MLVSDPNEFDALRTDDLLVHVRGGNQDAWREVYRRYRPFLTLAITEETGLILEDPDDVIQSAFLSAWKDIEQFSYRGGGSLRAWLRRIVVHKNLEKLRKLQRRRTTTTQSALETGWDETVVDPQQRDPAESAAAQDSQRRLFQCMDQNLKPIEREILMLRHFEYLSTPQVSEIVELAERTVRDHYKSGMERIARTLKLDRPME